MTQSIILKLTMPGDLRKFQLPAGVQRRLNDLLNRQDQGHRLSIAERREAEGLVDLVEMLSLLKLKAENKIAAAA